MLENLKIWCWSRPEYNETYWDKVDEVVDGTLVTAFENKFTENLVNVIDEGIEFLESRATKIANALNAK